MVWCAMDSPTTNGCNRIRKRCTEFWLCEYAWWTKVGSPLRSETNGCQETAEWPGEASLGGLTPQAAQIQEVMAMLGSMVRDSYRQCSSIARSFCNYATEKRGSRSRGDGLPPGTGNGGCNRSDGLPPVPRTPKSAR